MMRTSLDVATGKPGPHHRPAASPSRGSSARSSTRPTGCSRASSRSRTLSTARATARTVSLARAARQGDRAARGEIASLGLRVQQRQLADARDRGSTLLPRLVANLIDNAIRHNDRAVGPRRRHRGRGRRDWSSRTAAPTRPGPGRRPGQPFRRLASTGPAPTTARASASRSSPRSPPPTAGRSTWRPGTRRPAVVTNCLARQRDARSGASPAGAGRSSGVRVLVVEDLNAWPTSSPKGSGTRAWRSMSPTTAWSGDPSST